jgi:hypothetical protein
MGLPTFEFALMPIDADLDEIPFHRGGMAASGTAFVTRATAGHTWGGTTEELDNLVNPGIIFRLVIFDTWTLNCDRHPPDLTQRKPNYDNVFLADGTGVEDGAEVGGDGSFPLLYLQDLNAKVATVDRVRMIDCTVVPWLHAESATRRDRAGSSD